MNTNLRKLYVDDINTLFKKVDSSLSVMDNIQFAEVAHILLEDMLGLKIDRRGQSLTGEPVGYVLDSTSEDFKVVAEYSCEKKYFEDKTLSKIKNDIQHCLDKAPNTESIYLISSQTAGPLNYTTYSNYADNEGKRLNKNIYIYDARKLSEYIVDEVISKQNELLLQKLINFIPLVKQLKIEHIFTNTIPQKDDDFVERIDNKERILELLEEHNYVLLHGISGIGKTEISKDIANQYKEEYSLVWIDGKLINEVNDLNSITLERYGVSQNIIGLMNRSKICLVIDDLNKNISKLISFMHDNIKTNFKLIMTSQVNEQGIESELEINFLPLALSEEVLNKNLELKCPKNILNEIDTKIGGHPFLLKQINILIKENDLSWDEILSELDILVATPVDNQKTFYNKLFEKHVEALEDTLSCLKWINNKDLEYSLLKALIGITGIKELEKRAFFNIRNKTRYSLHDLVFNSLAHIKVEYDESIFRTKFSNLLKNLYLSYNSNYFRIIYSHNELIKRLVNNQYDVFSYSYINALSVLDVNNSILLSYDESKLTSLFQNYTDNKYFELFTWIELIEKEYLHKKNNLPKDDVKKFLLEKISIIETHLENSNLPENVFIEVQNHLAKYYRNTSQKEKAIEIFEDILNKQNDYWVAKLHLSKLLRFDTERKKEAENLIKDILEAYKEKQQVSSTVVLASFMEIRSYKELEREYLIDLIDHFYELIDNVMVEKFDLPYQVLSALSSRIQFKYPEKMTNITEGLPIPSEESGQKSILFNVGEIYHNTSKAYFDLKNNDKAIENAEMAKIYFDKMKYTSDYQKRLIAENFLLLHDINSAMKILEDVSEGKREIWWEYTYSKALSMNGQDKEARNLISQCIDKATYSQDTFYRERANIKIKADECPCDDLSIALKYSKDEKFSQMIKNEIEKNKCS